MKSLMYNPASVLNMFIDDFETTTEIKHNIGENNTDYVVEVVAPGYNKNEFSISIDRDYLIVTVAKDKSEESSETKYHRKSYVSKSFTKKFLLNNEVDLENIKANYENGILYIKLPKSKNKISRQIEIM